MAVTYSSLFFHLRNYTIMNKDRRVYYQKLNTTMLLSDLY